MELIGQCPEENAQKVADRLTYLMKQSALPEVTVPFKCDPTIEKRWYMEDYTDMIRSHYEKFLSETNDKQSALQKLYSENCECTVEEINEMLGEN